MQRHGIEVGPDDAFSLAREFEATPGVAAGATAAARLGGGDLAAVRRGVRSLSRVLSCEKPPEGTPACYDPALLRADTDPVRLADRLVRSGASRCACKGRRAWARARAPSCATLPNALAWRSCRSGRRT